MKLHRSLSPRVLRYTATAIALFLPVLAGAQETDRPTPGPPMGGAAPQGLNREAMWPAPTAADWARPCLVTWQRSWEDALAVASETQRPILVCVNMDGEIASEHYAGIRYRQPDIAVLYEPYVTVIASVYRHSPRDYDQDGNRILCPRFGSVTCGEHIAIEPILFEKFMEGRRIAPRHICVELDGSESYDVFYTWDTQSVFDTIRAGMDGREGGPVPIVRGDRSIVERVASRDVRDRKAVEEAYRSGDSDLRRALLQAAIEHAGAAPDGLLRQAIFGLDLELAGLARAALAKTVSADSVDLLAEALRVPMEEGERAALVSALERLGEASPEARTLAVVHKGLSGGPSSVQVSAWSDSLAGAEYPAPAENLGALESRVDGGAAASAAQPESGEARLELAEASLALAVDPLTHRRLAADPRNAGTYTELMFQDAYRAASEAEQLGADGFRVDAALAISSWYLGRREEAHARAEAAMRSLPGEADSWNAMGVLSIFAEARREAILRALRARESWPPEWMADVHAAYSVIAHHPHGTDEHVVLHHDFLRRLRADGEAQRVLDEGLARFPDSWVLHDRLRGRILREKGVDALEPAYELMLAAPEASSNLAWFAGYTSIVAAEFHRRVGADEEAHAAYERALGHYERATLANPAGRAESDHYAALALAGQARIALERDELERAVEWTLASFARRSEAAATLDGLNLSPVDTAKMLLSRLHERRMSAAAARLQAALSALDPKLLELPAYEREVPPQGDERRGRRGR